MTRQDCGNSFKLAKKKRAKARKNTLQLKVAISTGATFAEDSQAKLSNDC